MYLDQNEYPLEEQVEDNDSGGAYGRTRYSHPISGGMRKPSRSSIGILKERVPTGLVNEMDMNYIPSGEYHGSGRPPRLTNAIKQKILMMHPELQQIHMSGGAINWNKIWSGIKKSASVVGKIASHPLTQQLAGDDYKKSLQTTGDVANALSGLGRGCNGSGFWKDFGTGFKQGFKGANKVASKVLPIASIFQPELAPLAAASVAADQAFGKGRRKKASLPKSGKKRNTARGDIVRAIMVQRGVNLGQASRIVKQEGLY
jgi:hypothetical protein